MAMEEIRTTSTTTTTSGSGRMSETNPMKKNHGGMVGGIVIIVILLLLAFWFSGMSSPDAMTGDSREIAPGQILTDAPQGDVVAGFPKELLLEEGVATDQSYSITYTDGNMSQPVVTYRSAKALDENVDAYKSYLLLNGWSITHMASAQELPTTFFYAYKDSAEVNVTFASQEEGIMVTIAYVVRAQ